jgi:hypothetical protein
MLKIIKNYDITLYGIDLTLTAGSIILKHHVYQDSTFNDFYYFFLPNYLSNKKNIEKNLESAYHEARIEKNHVIRVSPLELEQIKLLYKGL